jgi:hypothetical protein
VSESKEISSSGSLSLSLPPPPAPEPLPTCDVAGVVAIRRKECLMSRSRTSGAEGEGGRGGGRGEGARLPDAAEGAVTSSCYQSTRVASWGGRACRMPRSEQCAVAML